MKQFIESVKKLLADSTSGSGDLLTSLITALSELVARQKPDENLKIPAIHEQLTRIRDTRPVFMILQHFIREFMQFAAKEPPVTASAAKAFIDAYIDAWKDVNDRISDNFHQLADIKGKTMLLHSNSSTVTSLFSSLQVIPSGIRIIQTESRPVMEGRIQGARLADMGFPVTLISDASVSMYMPQADMAILGADAVYPRYFINKTGSHSIAMACREYGKPCVVVCDSRKIIPAEQWDKSTEAFDQSYPAMELWIDPPENVIIENHYFEKIPNYLVSRFVFEDRTVEGKNLNNTISQFRSMFPGSGL